MKQVKKDPLFGVLVFVLILISSLLAGAAAFSDRAEQAREIEVLRQELEVCRLSIPPPVVDGAPYSCVMRCPPSEWEYVEEDGFLIGKCSGQCEVS